MSFLTAEIAQNFRIIKKKCSIVQYLTLSVTLFNAVCISDNLNHLEDDLWNFLNYSATKNLRKYTNILHELRWQDSLIMHGYNSIQLNTLLICLKKAHHHCDNKMLIWIYLRFFVEIYLYARDAKLLIALVKEILQMWKSASVSKLNITFISHRRWRPFEIQTINCETSIHSYYLHSKRIHCYWWCNPIVRQK